MTFKIGLTGLIGSGKSLAAQYFAKLGVAIVDTDTISHEVTKAGGRAIPLIISAFGREYITENGALDRSRMRDLVFNNKEEKYKLEAILHPMIFEEVVAQVNETTSQYVIIVVPLLFISHRYVGYIDRSIYVNCDENTIIQRVINRNCWTQDTIMAALANQMPADEQLSLADDVLDNNCSFLELEHQVQRLHEKYTSIIDQVKTSLKQKI